jgi:dTMP kinase
LRGRLLCLEGIDGAGTTTQRARLAGWLSGLGLEVHVTREPSDGPIGTLVRQVLGGRLVGPSLAGGPEPFDRGALALLFAADRLDHVAAEIAPRLRAGQVVLTDRYLHSSLAYQSLDLPSEWVESINARAKTPDLAMWVRVDPGVAVARIQARQGAQRDIYEQLGTLEAVHRHYARLFAPDSPSLATVDGDRPVESVTAALQAAIVAWAAASAESAR